MTDAMPNRDADLLLVDDDQELRGDVASFFQSLGYRVDQCADGRSALEQMRRQSYDAAIVDLQMPDLSGIDLLSKLHEADVECPVIILTGKGTVETAVEAMKLGAADFVAKPVRLRELDAIIQRVLEAQHLRKENSQLRAVLKQQQPYTTMIGESPAMREVFRLIERIGPTDKAVLVQGESGTGKELVAQAIHRSSPLRDKPLVTVNCAAIPETLLESELFGHEKGAFTGAIAAKAGLFELADGGTLFVDEIGELTPPLQAKLLRVLEDGVLRRVGSIKQRRVRVRLIAATHRNLAEAIEKGEFREDLYYRINVLTIDLPPLRNRPGDIALLVRHFVGPDWQIDREIDGALEQYAWPGNIRQLRNAIERAKILSDDSTLHLANFPPEIAAPQYGTTKLTLPAGLDLDKLNEIHIRETYRRHQRNKARTARALGVSRRTLYRLIEKYQIEQPEDSARISD